MFIILERSVTRCTPTIFWIRNRTSSNGTHTYIHTLTPSLCSHYMLLSHNRLTSQKFFYGVNKVVELVIKTITQPLRCGKFYLKFILTLTEKTIVILHPSKFL